MLVGSADISACGSYRYRLSRRGEGPTVLVCMLNPSTADGATDDATIRKLRALLHGRPFTVINLYALRATDPRELLTAADPVGPRNHEYINVMLLTHTTVVCAWGTKAGKDRVEAFCGAAKARGSRLLCFGANKDGSPRHPLYLRSNTLLSEWKP